MTVKHAPLAAWPEVDPGTEVSLSDKRGQIVHEGTVVAKTTSGSTIWIISPSFERRMYHVDDGYCLTVEREPTTAGNVAF